MVKHEAAEARKDKIYVGGGIGSDSLGFDSYRWREAIMCYLNGLWSRSERVMLGPKIIFGAHLEWPMGYGWGEIGGGLWLKLNNLNNGYTIHGQISGEFPDPNNITSDVVARDEVLFVGCNNRTTVEVGLMRFVKDDSILQLWFIQGSGVLCLWKGLRRSELRIGAWNIPTEYF